MFKNNVGRIDRAVRAIVGIASIAAFFLFPDLAWRGWLLIGIVPLGTALLGWCPLYSVLGISTCPLKRT